MITLVTAFKDIGRGSWQGTLDNRGEIPSYIARDTKTYLDRFLRLSKLKNPIHVFVEESIRLQLYDKVGDNVTFHDINKIWNEHSHLLKDIQSIQDDEEFIKTIHNSTVPEYWNSEYVLINYLKTFFIDDISSNSLVECSDSFAWVDFGYVREESNLAGKIFTYDNDAITFFSNYPNNPGVPIDYLVKTGIVLIRGPLIIVKRNLTKDLKNMVAESLNYLMSRNMIDDDQTMLYYASKKLPCKVVYDGLDWFDTIKKNLRRCDDYGY